MAQKVTYEKYISMQMSKVSYFYTIAVEMHLGEEGHLRGWIWDGRVIRDSDEHFSKLGDDASDLRSSPRLSMPLQNVEEN